MLISSRSDLRPIYVEGVIFDAPDLPHVYAAVLASRTDFNQVDWVMRDPVVDGGNPKSFA